MAPSSEPFAKDCPAPPVIGPAYRPKGDFVEVHGVKVYCTGPALATNALMIIYDIFGYSSQIIQGADFLGSRGYKVFMPDFFQGKPAPLSYMPPPDAHGRESTPNVGAIRDFCSGTGNTERAVEMVVRLREALQHISQGTQRWGLVGYSWGGWITNHLLDSTSPFVTAAQVSPGFPSVELATTIARPLLVLCSQDEPASEYAHIRPHLRVEASFQHFPGMVHGWMSARGDLGRFEVQQDFRRGYEMLEKWFAQRL